MTAAGCKICGGPTRLLHAGTGGPPTPDELAPTNHDPGVYGDLWICERCGTVAQPALPAGDALHDLYRDMRDERYLDEEDGRRRTARRLLGQIEQQLPGGRLLDAGCGPGILLDEARKRGWATVGLDLSRSSAAHARDRLGLDVREVPLEAFDDDSGFDAIVLADVIEHFDDPRGALSRCVELLRPGGVLLTASPDPASRMARLAGGRWWGYLRAHAYLLPRSTLGRVLHETGFEVVGRRPLVRTFSAGYWFSGAAGRGGAAGALAAAVGRLVPDRLPLSLTLGDEYVVLARRPESLRAPSTTPAAASSTSQGSTGAL